MSTGKFLVINIDGREQNYAEDFGKILLSLNILSDVTDDNRYRTRKDKKVEEDETGVFKLID